MKPSIYVGSVPAPTGLRIAANAGNNTVIADWFAQVSLYVRSMRGVGRAVLVDVTPGGDLTLHSMEQR